mmetsp:Transcript_12438/g.18761  ORF Transcript_12438/g.18761 Transcript_12438/m.18761 type:complete len:415 (-) Transcript_12438:169-1413(-)
MHSSFLLTISAAATLNAVSARLSPDVDLMTVSNDGRPANVQAVDPAPSGGDTVTVTNLMVPIDEVTVAAPSDGEAIVTTLMVPASGDVSPNDGKVSIITTTGLQPEETIPELYQDSRLVGPTWTATKYYDTTRGELVDVTEGSTITLEFENDGRFDGYSGCNHYFGRYVPTLVSTVSVARSNTNSKRLADSSFTIPGQLGSTMMMCENDLIEQERVYLENLNGTINYNLSQDGSALELKDAETDTIIAEYNYFAPLVLDQTWTATKYYNSEEDGLVDVIPGSTITLNMEINESLIGSGGCNRYFGSYDDLTSTSFAIVGDIGSTKMLCDEPDNVMEQEEMYLKNFADGREIMWAILDDGSLELRDSGADVVIALYNAEAEVVKSTNLLPTSGGMDIGTPITVFAMMAIIAMAAW